MMNRYTMFYIKLNSNTRYGNLQDPNDREIMLFTYEKSTKQTDLIVESLKYQWDVILSLYR